MGFSLKNSGEAMHSLLHELLILLATAVVFVPLFRAFGVGAILAYLAAGVAIGPEVFGLIGDPKSILHFSELGVVFLLFLIGLELKPSRLWSMRRSVFGLGLAQLLLTGALLTGLGVGLGLEWQAAVVAGFGLGLSSTAFGLQILEENRQLNTLHGQGSFSILLFQDLAVVPLIALVPILASGGASEPTQWLGVARTLGILVAFIVFGLYFIRHAFNFIARSRVQEVFTATSLLIVIGSAVLMEEAGLSMGTGAFLAGVLLANSEYRHELEVNLEPFKGLLLGLFFMAVGMSLDLTVLASQPHWVALVLVGFMVVKIAIIFGLGRLFGFPYESSRNMAFTLPQGGEFAFVLFAAASAAHLFTAEESAILTAAVTLSMALTPLLFNGNQRFLRTFSEITERPYDSIPSGEAQVIVAGFGRFGQIVARFLKTQGVAFTILEHSAAQVDTARRFGTKIFYGDASREDIMESAGGKTAKILVLAIDDVETSLKTARMARSHFPDLKIVARVRNRQHANDMRALGVEEVYRETYLTSLEVARDVMVDLGSSSTQIDEKVRLFRQHDEEVLRKQYAYRGDEKGLISLTTRANEELALILKSDDADEPVKKPV